MMYVTKSASPRLHLTIPPRDNVYISINSYPHIPTFKSYAVQIHFFTPFNISNADLTALKNKKHKINSRNLTYDGLTFSSSFWIFEEVKDEI